MIRFRSGAQCAACKRPRPPAALGPSGRVKRPNSCDTRRLRCRREQCATERANLQLNRGQKRDSNSTCAKNDSQLAGSGNCARFQFRVSIPTFRHSNIRTFDIRTFDDSKIPRFKHSNTQTLEHSTKPKLPSFEGLESHNCTIVDFVEIVEILETRNSSSNPKPTNTQIHTNGACNRSLIVTVNGAQSSICGAL